ncbi:sigma-70 family RNA polymerase sigma factor [Gordonia sp. Z-3]|uniref:RNA polymerase sigma factor n=1 Tax=Gordonia sp. Z-3 TaxID=3115408 RepID=UPI002E27E746|nr:sigma-70 family RNA polymerase sigma factor [Gordonia sp. Z-3]MED5801139.1 sigma-70 family RNA polymerase sigma factor [Gordonia sp. Z-3]
MSAPLETGDPRPTNEMVVAALRSGDMQALGVVYDRYGAALHTFAYSMVRSRERAADVTHDSLLIAVARIGQLRDPARLRPWLYAIVRSECLRALRGTKRETVFTDWHDTADDDLPDAELHRQEIRELVRSALDGLSPKDREVMELSLHHDLDNAEIAAVLGVSPSHVTALTSRSRKALERSLGTLLVARAGGEGCDELTQLLQPWDGNFTPLWRKRIAKHVDSCASCTGERRRRFTPAAILVALPMLAAPIVLRDRVMTDAEPVLAAYAQHAGEAQAATSVPGPVDANGADVVPNATSTTIIAGQPAWDYPIAAPTGRRWWLWTTAAVAVLVVSGAIVAAVTVGADTRVEPTPVVDAPVVESEPAQPATSAPTIVVPSSVPDGTVLPPPDTAAKPDGVPDPAVSRPIEPDEPPVSSPPEVVPGRDGEPEQPDPAPVDPEQPDPAPELGTAACPPLCGPSSDPAGPAVR